MSNFDKWYASKYGNGDQSSVKSAGAASVDASGGSNFDKWYSQNYGAGSQNSGSALSGLAQFGIEVDDAILQRAKDNYAKTFKSDYDLDYDMERQANGLMPKSYDKKYDSASALDRYLYENNLPDSKKFAEYYNKAADELNKERETERKEQEKLLKEQAPLRQYQSLYNEIGKDLTPYLDLETGELSEEKILDFVYGKFGEEGYAELADAWKQYKDDEDYDTHEEMLIAQAAQNDPDTYNIKRLMDELNEGRKKAQNEQAAKLAEETGIGTTETSGLYGILPMAGSTEGSEKSPGTERPNIPILNSPALGGTGETTTMTDIEETEERKAETVAQKAEWDLQDEELRAAIDTSGQRHLSGGLGATVEQIFNEDIQAQVDAYMAAADAEGKWTPFEVDQALRRANLDMYLHRDGKSFSDREVKNYAIATLQASGMTLEQAEAYFANMTDEELKTFEADMAFDTRVHADTSQEFGESLVSIPIRAVVNTWAGMVGLADMVAGVVDSDRDLWDYTKKMQEEAAKWQQYGHSERHETLNVISDVGSELLRMYALHLAGVGLASHAAGTGGLTAASLTTAQKGTGAILSTFAKGVRASAGSAPFVANAMGSYFTQAMQSGANRQQATGFAVFAGVMEGALESFGADAMFNKALSARMVKRMTLGAKGALTSPAAFKFVQVATSAIGNGMEEGASYILAGLGEMAFFNKNWRPDANELMDNVKMGFIVGSLGAMAGSASDSRAYAIYQQMLEEGYSPQLLDAGVYAAQVEAMPKAKVEARVQNAIELTQDEYAQAVYEKAKAAQDDQNAQEQYERQIASADERTAAAETALSNLRVRAGAADTETIEGATAFGQLSKEIASAQTTYDKTIESAEAVKQTARKEYESASASANQRGNAAQRKLDDHAIASDLRTQAEAVQSALNTTGQRNVTNGRATVITTPYTGDIPERMNTVSPTTIEIVASDVADAQRLIQEGGKDESSLRKYLKGKYKELLGDRFDNKTIVVEGTYFGGHPYAVKLYKNLIGKVISDKRLSAEKLSVLNSLESVIENAEYVGSAEYNAEGKKTKDVIRYDYFETPITIGGKEYIVALSVEAKNIENRFRTYMLESIELHPAGVPRTGTVPASFAQSDAVPAIDSIAESAGRMQEPDSQNGDGVAYVSEAEYGKSRFRENTLNKFLNEADLALMDETNNLSEYEIRTEKNNLILAKQRLAEHGNDVDQMTYLLFDKSRPWDSVDVDIAMAIMNQRIAEGRHAEASDMALEIRERATSSGQSIQAFAKYTRTTAGLVSEAAKNVQDAEKNATPKQKETIAKETREIQEAIENGEDIEKKVENALGSKKPSAKKKALEQIRDMIEKGEADPKKIRDIVKQANDLPVLTEEDIQGISDNMARADDAFARKQQAQAAGGDKAARNAERDMRKHQERAAQIVADKAMVDNRTKFRSFQRIMMLLNTKSNIKNFAANIPMFLMENIKDLPAALFDTLASKVTGERTTSGNIASKLGAQFTAAGKAAGDIAYDFKNKVDTSNRNMPGRYGLDDSGRMRMTNASPRIWKNSLMNAADNLVGAALRSGDRMAFEAAYDGRLRELRLLGKDISGIEAQREAVRYALDRTFQLNSNLAQTMSGFRNGLNKFGEAWLGTKFPLGDLILPFVQTPANITDKLLDYSGVGLVRGITQLVGAKKNGEFDQKLFVDRLGRSFTGFGIIALGFALSKAGALTGGAEDKEEREMMNNAGVEEYAIQIGNKWHTLDWAEPAANLLFMGAAMQKAGMEKDTFAEAMLAAGIEGTNALFELEILQNIQALFGGYGSLGENIASSLLGTATQFTPSAMNGVTKVIDPVVRDTYDPNLLKQTLNKVLARMPGLNYLLPGKVGTDGREQMSMTGDTAGERFLQGWILPNYISTETDDAVNSELWRLHHESGMTGHYLPVADKKLDGVKLTADEYREYQKEMGEACYAAAKKVINGYSYSTWSDELRSEKISDAVSDAESKVRKRWKKAIAEERVG